MKLIATNARSAKLLSECKTDEDRRRLLHLLGKMPKASARMNELLEEWYSPKIGGLIIEEWDGVITKFLNSDIAYSTAKTIHKELISEFGVQFSKLCKKPKVIDSMKAKRTPIGVKPKWLWLELRVKDINGAIDRYKKAGQAIPQEWSDELNDIHLQLVYLESNKKE